MLVSAVCPVIAAAANETARAALPLPSKDVALSVVTCPVSVKSLAVAKEVAVSALPVTSPVTLPSILATRVPVVIVKLPVLAPVAVLVPKVNLSTLSSHTNIALSPVLPLSITIPQSLALLLAPLLSSIRVSATTVLVVLTVVVEPFTVKSPVIERF